MAEGKVAGVLITDLQGKRGEKKTLLQPDHSAWSMVWSGHEDRGVLQSPAHKPELTFV